MYLLFQPVGIFNNNIDAFLQCIIRINTVLNTFAVAFDRRNRCFQVMGNIVNHFFLRLFLLAQLFPHAYKCIRQFTDLIPPVYTQVRILAKLDTFDIVSYLIQGVNQRQYPHHHNDEEEADNYHRDIDNAVNQ